MIDKEQLKIVVDIQVERLKASMEKKSIFEKLKAISEVAAFLTILSIDKEVDKLKGISVHMQVKGYDTTEVKKWLNGYNSIQQHYFQVK